MKFLIFILLLFFCSSAFSQTEPKSLHPKLDKYYPQADNTPPPQPTPAIIAPPVTKAAPVHEIKPVVTSNSTIEQKPAIQTTLPKQDSIVESTPAVESKPLVENEPLKAVADSTNLQKPVNVVVAQPEQKVLPIQPMAKPKAIYMDTRLGSSSPLYDTYETNNNGAGSVTTMPKR